MKSAQFDILKFDLYRAQYGKRQGLVLAPLLESFVRFVETTDRMIEQMNFTMEGSLASATLTPKTREKVYDSSLHKYPTVDYCGPYTAVHYESGEWRIERCEGRTEWYEVDREYKEGVAAYIEFNGSASLDRLVRIAKRRADLREVYISGVNGRLFLRLHIPLERLTLMRPPVVKGDSCPSKRIRK